MLSLLYQKGTFGSIHIGYMLIEVLNSIGWKARHLEDVF